jgi:NADH:ubiquinone oxidoreductase subunit 4 (subunit M)
MIYIIGKEGSRKEERIKATKYIVMYTIVSSVLMIVAIMMMKMITGTTEMRQIRMMEEEVGIMRII